MSYLTIKRATGNDAFLKYQHSRKYKVKFVVFCVSPKYLEMQTELDKLIKKIRKIKRQNFQLICST
jgi:hypothetical protein